MNIKLTKDIILERNPEATFLEDVFDEALIGSATPCGKKIIAVFVYGSIIALFTINFIYIFRQFHYVAPLPYITGKISRDDYIERFRPEFRVIRFANQNLPETAKILALFIGNRGYYFDRELFFGQGWFKKQIKHANSPNAIKTSLKKNGITHLLLRNDLFSNWLDTVFNSNEKQIFLSFFNDYATMLHSHAGYSLFIFSS